MRVALISGHFMPELGYQEVYLARSFARAGHSVRVFTSTVVSPSGRGHVKHSYEPGLSADPASGYGVLRLPVRFCVGANVVSRGLKAAVLDYQPDVVVIVAVAKLFPGALLGPDVAGSARLVALFGDAREYADMSTLGKRWRTKLQRLLFLAVKRRLYRKAVRYCDRIVLNHPETRELLTVELDETGRKELAEKGLELTLGFDPEEFFLDVDERNSMRTELGVEQQDVVVATCTRVKAGKGLERIIENVSALRRDGLSLRYVLAGFQDDAYAAQLKKFIADQPFPEIFTCYPLLSHEKVRALYCGADIGIWVKAAISIQEAMGTGLAVLLEEKPVVGHLVREGVNGWYYPTGELPDALRKAVLSVSEGDSESRDARRAATLTHNQGRFSYDAIARRVIDPL